MKLPVNQCSLRTSHGGACVRLECGVALLAGFAVALAAESNGVGVYKEGGTDSAEAGTCGLQLYA